MRTMGTMETERELLVKAMILDRETRELVSLGLVEEWRKVDAELTEVLNKIDALRKANRV